jgi:hypothetical protein
MPGFEPSKHAEFDGQEFTWLFLQVILQSVAGAMMDAAAVELPQ